MPPGPSDGAARCQRVAPVFATGLLRYCERVAPLYIRCTTVVHPLYIRCTTVVRPLYNRCTTVVHPLYNRCTSLVPACALRSHYGKLNCIPPHLNTEYGMAENTRPHVVVLGAGFGGLTFCQHFHHAGAQVTLVDRANHHLFQPLLYQVATAGLSAPDIAQPIRSILAARPEVTVLMEIGRASCRERV